MIQSQSGGKQGFVFLSIWGQTKALLWLSAGSKWANAIDWSKHVPYIHFPYIGTLVLFLYLLIIVKTYFPLDNVAFGAVSPNLCSSPFTYGLILATHEVGSSSEESSIFISVGLASCTIFFNFFRLCNGIYLHRKVLVKVIFGI